MITNKQKDIHSDNNQQSISWASIFYLILLSATFYSLMEWLFFATKPSFMDNITFLEKINLLLFNISLIGFILNIIILFPFFILFTYVFDIDNYIIKIVFLTIPSLVISLSGLLIIDNFTYTVFRIGIIGSDGFLRVLFLLLFSTILIFTFVEMKQLSIKFSNIYSNKIKKNKKLIFINVILLFAFLAPLFYNFQIIEHNVSFYQEGTLINNPNIILITVEAIEANNVSFYGYERSTTPNMDKISEYSLIGKNAFANSAHTTGSLTSILTGKHPLNTKVLYPPNILTGEDSFQHLPGILQSIGYYTAQYGLEHFADAYQVNLLNGFNEANGRSQNSTAILTLMNRILSGNVTYYLIELSNRILTRINHLLFLKNTENVFLQLSGGSQNFNDWEKFTNTLSLIDEMDQPIFAHIHYMNTHGSRMIPDQQHYSLNMEPHEQGIWYDSNFYDDAILEFDAKIGRFWNEIQARNLENETLLIILSDHGRFYRVEERLLFIIKFPKSEFVKLISDNIQNIDVPPTVLDYLGLQKPEWMDGQSLISDTYKTLPVFSVSSNHVIYDEYLGWVLSEESTQPPFYQFQFLTLIDCHVWYKINLDDFSWSYGEVYNRSHQCLKEQLLSNDDISQLTVETLLTNGFSLSTEIIENIQK